MGLESGTRLGPYKVLSPIGAGGMGEVYRARDTKLERDVAIKVLPEEFASDPERLARFEREAKLLASLNHPSIASIHGFEESDGINALVLELVEGPTLSERIAQAPIPVDEAIAIAKQIAEALEAGHEAGVVHRDLKPANVKVKEDGTVKVLDYGLAKALEDEAPVAADSELSQSPTLTRQGTQVGVILGTAAYMSPEQAKGKRVDRRADIWAFGAVVYEMLTGKRAFAGEDVSDTLAAVLRAEPDLEALPGETPESLRLVLRLCLSKNVTERFQSIGDVRLAMEGAFEMAPSPSESAAARGGVLPWVGLALVLGAALGIGVWSSTRPESPRALARFVVDSSVDPRGAVITPDGSHVIYRKRENDDVFQRVFVRGMHELEGTPIGLSSAVPFVSPDGLWVGYFDATGLWKISIQGGPPIRIAELPVGRVAGGASWGDDDTIVFVSAPGSGLWSVPAGGGEPQELITPDALGGGVQPEILPGGGAALLSFAMLSVEYGDTGIAVVSLDSGDKKTLVQRGFYPRYAPTGHIVYALEGALFAVGFDLDRLEVTTDPVPVVEGIFTNQFTGGASFGISRSGSLVYVTAPQADRSARTLVWVDREGREEPLAAEPRAYTYPRMSPDGTRLAVEVRDVGVGSDIWIWEFARETMSRLTFDPAFDMYPTWTPDSARVAFGSMREGPWNLFWKAADGTGSVEQLTNSDYQVLPQTFSPDGTRLVFRQSRGGNVAIDLGVRSMDSDGTLEPLLATEFDERNAEVSPDGSWFAYESNASGQFEVYVRPFPDVDEGRWQISRAGGTAPLWGPAGRELFYFSQAGQLTAVPIQTNPFAAGNPEVVLSATYLTRPAVEGSGRTYDVSPDGKRFLMIKESVASAVTENSQLILVQNWLDELKRLVPVDH